ncbi:MAG: autotransporter domain-containing protein [Oceanicaulis sp.]
MITRKNVLLLSTAILTVAQAAPGHANDELPEFGAYIGPDETRDIVVEAGEVIEAAETGVFFEGLGAIYNAGLIRSYGTTDVLGEPLDGAVIITSPGVRVVNTGQIIGDGLGVGTAYQFDPDTGTLLPIGIGVTVENSGLIQGGVNDGVRLIGGGTVINTGVIEGLSGDLTDGVSMFTFEGQDRTGQSIIGTVTNSEGGVISGPRHGVILTGGGAVTNAGTISGGYGSGVRIQAAHDESGKLGEVINTGVLDGATGVYFFAGLEQATLTNSGSVTGLDGAGVVSDIDGTLVLTNTADGRITGLTGVHALGGALNLVNDGVIVGTGGAEAVFGNAGVRLTEGSSTVVNTGSITGANYGLFTDRGVDENGAPAYLTFDTRVENSGSIVGQNNDGVLIFGGGEVINSGVISGQGEGAFWADGIQMQWYPGVDSGQAQIGAVTNLEGGLITGNRYGIILAGGGSVTNAGEISGGERGVLIVDQNFAGKTGELDNSGVIRNGVLFSTETVTVTNSGLIEGPDAIVLDEGVLTALIENSGSLIGQSGLGVRNEIFADLTLTNSVGGLISGQVSGVYSNGSLTLVNDGRIEGFGTYDGLERPSEGGVAFAGPDSSIVNTGEIVGAGFGVSSLMAYNAELDRLEGRAFGSTVVNSGLIRGETNDGVRLIGGGTVTNTGTIEGVAGGLTDGVSMYAYDDQDTSGQTGIGTVTNLTGGAISGARFGVILTGGGVIENAGTIRGGLGGLQVQDLGSGKTGSIVNSGAVEGGAIGVRFSGTLEGVALTNSGTITATTGAGVRNDTAASLVFDNTAHGAVSGARTGVESYEGALVLTNAGLIEGLGVRDPNVPGFAEAGVRLHTGESVITNTGVIRGAEFGVLTTEYRDFATGDVTWRVSNTQLNNSGRITGLSNDAVLILGGGDVVNSGVIEGFGPSGDGVQLQWYPGADSGLARIGSVTNQEGGVITGERYGIILAGGGEIANAGLIRGAWRGVLLVNQNFDGKTGALANSGVIEGGVTLNLASATVTNTGSIVSETAEGLISDGQIVFVNAGVLSGGNGVAARLSGFDDTVTLLTGSDVSGVIDAGLGVDLLTLRGELDAESASQTLGGASGFESLDVEAGYWTTSGAVGAFDGVQVRQGATLKLVGVAGETGEEGLTTSNITDESPIETGSVLNDGLLVFDFVSDQTVDADLSISGTGGVRFEGPAVFTVNTDTFTYTGRTDIANGGLVLNGALASSVIETSGAGVFTLGETGVFNGDLVNNGTFVFNRASDYDFLGDISGSGRLIKDGQGTLTFSGAYNFLGVTEILAGVVKIAGEINPETVFDLEGEGQLTIAGTSQTIAGLSGTGGTSVVIEGATLTVNQTTDSEFAGTISGDGGFVKAGGGTLNLTGTSTLTGDTTINDGVLKVNGSIASSTLIVNPGGTLGGTGVIGGAVIDNGGVFAPGNSIGTLAVDGDVVFTAGSTYEVEVDAAGGADRIDATGAFTIENDVTLAVLAADGAYAPLTDYTIATADAVNGAFSSVTTDLAFLTPLVRYEAEAVRLSLYRNDISFADVALNPNQRAVAAAAQARGNADAIHDAILMQNAAGARGAFDALSGEALASVSAALLDDSRADRGVILRRAAAQTDGVSVFGAVTGARGESDEGLGLAALETDRAAALFGAGFGAGAVSGGVAAGLSQSEHDVADRASRADTEALHVSAYASYRTGAFRATLGAALGAYEVETARTARFGAIDDALAAAFDADTRTVFGELAYTVTTRQLKLTPFWRGELMRVERDGFTETGGATALEVAAATFETGHATLGLDAQLNRDGAIRPYVNAGWRHGWGDLDPAINAAFADGAGGAFGVTGAALPENAAVLDAGLESEFGRAVIGAGYSGLSGTDWMSHSVNVTLRVRF